MCDPTTMIVMTVASSLMQAKAAREEGKFRNKTAQYNARVAQNQAQAVRAKGTEEENIQRRKTAELVSKQRAQLGASNVEIDSGSALQLQEDSRVLGEADSLRIRSNAEDQASALETGADLTLSQGAYAQVAGNNAATGALIAGGAQIASSGVADNWYDSDSAINQPYTTQSGVTAYPLRD